MEISAEASRAPVILDFNEETHNHQPTKFQQNRAMCGWIINDSTLFLSFFVVGGPNEPQFSKQNGP